MTLPDIGEGEGDGANEAMLDTLVLSIGDGSLGATVWFTDGLGVTVEDVVTVSDGDAVMEMVCQAVGDGDADVVAEGVEPGKFMSAAGGDELPMYGLVALAYP